MVDGHNNPPDEGASTMRRSIYHDMVDSWEERAPLYGDSMAHPIRILEAWDVNGASLAFQVAEVYRLFGVDTCPSTIRNTQNRRREGRLALA